MPLEYFAALLTECNQCSLINKILNDKKKQSTFCCNKRRTLEEQGYQILIALNQIASD